MKSAAVSENDVEQAALRWLAGLGWATAHGPDISPPDAKTPGTERASYRDVVLAQRLRDAIARLNPQVPAGARDDALRRVLIHTSAQVRLRNISICQRYAIGFTCRIRVNFVRCENEHPVQLQTSSVPCFASNQCLPCRIQCARSVDGEIQCSDNVR